MQQEQFPEFFRQAPTVLMRDPLAQFLGATPDGIIAYGYADAVRLAGHSCPTVASAYLMVVKGLAALYGDEIPERGGIEVAMQGGKEEGHAGVIASVAQLITGAAPETGFGGIGPRALFGRKNLLTFAQADVQGTLRLRRRDNGKAVDVSCNAGIVPFAPQMQELMPLAVSGRADEAQLKQFGALWQQRVREILVEYADSPELVQVQAV